MTPSSEDFLPAKPVGHDQDHVPRLRPRRGWRRGLRECVMRDRQTESEDAQQLEHRRWKLRPNCATATADPGQALAHHDERDAEERDVLDQERARPIERREAARSRLPDRNGEED